MRTTCPEHSRHRAGCGPCRERAAAYERRRSRLRAYGTWDGRVDPGPAREHVDRLLRSGMSRVQISAAAGVSAYSVRMLAAGRARFLYAATAAAILGVRPAGPVPARQVPAVGSRRRVQALMVMGWAPRHVADRAGVIRETVSRLTRGSTRWTLQRTADSVAEVYQALSHLSGPSVQAARRAERLGWAPPAAWDDDRIDDPRARPQGLVRRERAA